MQGRQVFWPCSKRHFVSLLQLDSAWVNMVQVLPSRSNHGAGGQDARWHRAGAGAPKRSPVATPTARAGAALGQELSCGSDLRYVSSHASDSCWQLWGVKSLNFPVKAQLPVIPGARVSNAAHTHAYTYTYLPPVFSFLLCFPICTARENCMGPACLTARQANLSLQGVNHSLTTLLRLIHFNSVSSQWVLFY